MPNQQYASVLSPRLSELLGIGDRWHALKDEQARKKYQETTQEYHVFHILRLAFQVFFLQHLQRWLELYSAVNWGELHNMSTLESMRRDLGDLQNTWNSSDTRKMTAWASCCLFTQRWGNISEAENYWEFTLRSWTLTAAVTSVSYVQSFFLFDSKIRKYSIAS